jgi:acyl carrier protein
MDEKLKKIVADIMEVKTSEIKDESGPDNIDNWDSLTHVKLVMDIEKEFKIQISPEEGIENFNSYKEIKDFINKKI